MFRTGSLSLLGIILVTITSIAANGPDDPDSRMGKTLSVQTAMARARNFMSEKQASKAVEALEEQLRNVNGNAEYLSLLRDAYRGYIRDLYIAGQPDRAKRYLDRLCILDPQAANDPTLRPQHDAVPHTFEQDPIKQVKLLPDFPKWKVPQLPYPFAKKEDPKGPPIVQGTVRGVSDTASIVDPFDRKNQRDLPSVEKKADLARDCLTRGEAEFKNKRYAEARLCFEQAYHADESSLEMCKAQWAYCIIKGVADAIEQPGVPAAKLSEFQKQVEAAIQMAPTKMMAKGQELLQTIEERAKQTPLTVAQSTKVKHWGQNKEGWQVAESPHFRIFHRQNNEYAERVAQIAESTRHTMYRKWFGVDGEEWQPVCELILHASVSGYTQMTGAPSNSPGHSRIEAEKVTGRVITRRMDMRLDINNMLETVLPHETTHCVLAGMFDSFAVPRWADEGIAVLSEPSEKVDQHRRNLLKNHKDGHLFGLKELMELKDYPQPRRIGAFYAQSVVLVEFLAERRGPKVFTTFVKDGLRHGYETALQRHYELTFTQLEQLWSQQVINNPQRFAATK